MSFLLHPMDALDRWFADDGEGFDIFIPLSLFFAFGIWLVFERYNRMNNSAVPFECRIPNASVWSLCLVSTIDPSSLYCTQEADPKWESKRIMNANLKSYLDDSELLPPIHHLERSYITGFDPATGSHIGTFLADNADDIA